MARRWVLPSLLALAALGCDPLVGGVCQEGYRVDGGRCVPVTSDADDEGTGGGSFDPGEGTGPTVPLGEDDRTPPLACAESLTACGDLCVDLHDDISHCGACGQHCPTQICVDGECLGEPAGHTVVIGMSYEQSSASSRRVLGNALFRTLHEPLRILEVSSWAVPSSHTGVAEAIEGQAMLRGRSVDISEIGPEQLADALDIGAFDVLLLHDPQLTAPDDLESLGMGHVDRLADFTASGGTIVALAGGQAVDPCIYLTAADLLPCEGTADITGAVVHNALPSDIVGNGVQSLFAAELTTATFDTPLIGDTTWVFTDDDGLPVVVHRVLMP